MEDATLDEVLTGKSLARFGDGEIMILDGRDARKQPWHADLAGELWQILEYPACMIGVPRAVGPNKKYWEQFLKGRGLTGWSSFISRPDEAPWIDTPEYRDKIRSLWRDRDVVLVRGAGSLVGSQLGEAKNVREIIARDYDAWQDVGAIEDSIGKAEIVLLCLGATATVLANRLARKGMWAVDIGSIGRWFQG